MWINNNDDDVSMYMVAGNVCACQAIHAKTRHVTGVVP